MLSNAKTIFDKVVDQLVIVYEPDEAKNLAFMVLEELIAFDKTDVLIERSFDLSAKQEANLSETLNRLLANEPIQYIFGRTTFYRLTLKVNKNVLIPRQETEELVDWIIMENHAAGRILDIGTGSGCIAISLAKGYTASEVHAWDVSNETLKVAKWNADTNQASVNFHLIDVLIKAPDVNFDLVVSNPPYVLEREKGSMRPNVLDHEPGIALFVPNQDPLLFYRRICKMCEDLLNPEGWLYFEINETHGQDIFNLLRDHSFINIEIRQDLNGKDRMVRGQKI